VGNGNIDVGNLTATRKPGQPTAEGLSGTGASEPRIDHPLKTIQPAITGAMSQQGGVLMGDNECAQQKLVRLVGCLDPQARLEFKLRQAKSLKR
jgi:hypothetical protein